MNDWLFTDMMKRELEAIFGVGFAVARFSKKKTSYIVYVYKNRTPIVNDVVWHVIPGYLEITLSCTKSSGQISLRLVTDVKCYDLLGHCITTILVFDYPEFQEFLLNTLQNRNVVAK